MKKRETGSVLELGGSSSAEPSPACKFRLSEDTSMTQAEWDALPEAPEGWHKFRVVVVRPNASNAKYEVRCVTDRGERAIFFLSRAKLQLAKARGIIGLVSVV